MVILSAGHVLAENLNLPPDSPWNVFDQVLKNHRKEIRQYLSKEAGQVIPVSKIPLDEPFNFWQAQADYTEKKDQRKLAYFMLARDLAHGERLLTSEDSKVRRSALGVFEVIAIFCATEFKEPKLGVAIADAFLMQNLQHCDPRWGQHLNRVHMLDSAQIVYTHAKDVEHMLATARLSLECAKTLNSQDAYRYKIADCLRKQKKYDDAISILKEVSDPSLIRAVPEMIKKFENERDKNKK